MPVGASRPAVVRFGTVDREVDLAMVPEAGEGDYVIVHAGFAISVMDAAAAERTLALLASVDGL
jgi:hydrogenase expression/formation protein HypC